MEPIEARVGDKVCVISKVKRGEYGRVLEKKNNVIMVELEESGEVVNMEKTGIATLIDIE